MVYSADDIVNIIGWGGSLICCIAMYYTWYRNKKAMIAANKASEHKDNIYIDRAAELNAEARELIDEARRDHEKYQQEHDASWQELINEVEQDHIDSQQRLTELEQTFENK